MSDRSCCQEFLFDFSYICLYSVSTAPRHVDRLWTTPRHGRCCPLQCRSYLRDSNPSSKLSHPRLLLSPSLLLHGTCLSLARYITIKHLKYLILIALFCSLAMFYVIALAGAHKRVINQLREQLVMVGLLNLLRPCSGPRFITQHLRHPCPTGGPWQAFPHPEAVPGAEGRCCQVSGVEATQQQQQLQLSHQLFQQFQRTCVPGTPDSWFCHTRVRRGYTSKDQTDVHWDKLLCSPTYLCFVLGFFFYLWWEKTWELLWTYFYYTLIFFLGIN